MRTPIPFDINENVLKKVALLGAVVGILALYVLSLLVEFEEKDISAITLDDKDSTIKLRGEVRSVSKRDNLYIITISQQSVITATLFSDNLTLQKDDSVEIIGIVTEYNNRPSINVQEISLK